MQRGFLFFLLIISVCFWSCNSSSNPYAFGKVDPLVLKRSSALYDSTAVAVVLFDIGKITLNRTDFEYTYTRHIRYQIFSEGGQKYADVKIPHWHKDKVYAIKAQTKLPDGTVIKLKSKDVKKEGDKDGWMYKVFAIPGVTSNCVIEYEYTRQSDNLHVLPELYFQNDIFTEYSEISIELPRGFNYNTTVFNAPNGIVEPEKSITVLPNNTKNFIFTWKYHDIPPFISEPYMTAKSNFMAKLDFQLVSFKNQYVFYEFVKSWETFTGEIYETYKPHFKPDSKTKDLAYEIIGSKRSVEDKIELLYNYTRDSLVTTDYKGYATIFIRKPKEIIATNSGSRVEKNLLLLSLLRSVGIDAEPILISTRSHGSFSELNPRYRSFNHVMVYVDTHRGKFFLDTKNKYCPYNMLPASDISGRGLVFNKNEHKFVDIPGPKTLSTVNYSTDGVIDSDGNLVASTDIRFDGYRNMNIRSNYDDSPTEDDFIDDYIINGIGNIELDSFKVSNLETPTSPLWVNLSYRIDNYADVAGNNIYLSPAIFDRWEENPFTLKERKYPIDYNYPIINEEHIFLKFPDGYKVVDAPASGQHSIAGHEYKRIVKVGPNRINYNHQNFVKNTVFSEYLYQDIKDYYSTVVSFEGDQIVLQKE